MTTEFLLYREWMVSAYLITGNYAISFVFTEHGIITWTQTSIMAVDRRIDWTHSDVEKCGRFSFSKMVMISPIFYMCWYWELVIPPTVGRICFLSPWVWVGPMTALSNRYDGSDIVPFLGKALTSLAGSSLCPLEENQWGNPNPVGKKDDFAETYVHAVWSPSHMERPCRERLASVSEKTTLEIDSIVLAASANARGAETNGHGVLCEFLPHKIMNK